MLVRMKQLLLTVAFAWSTVAFAQKPIFRYEPPYWDRFTTSILTDAEANSLYLVVANKDFAERIRITPSGRENLLHQGALTSEDFKVNYRLDEKTQRLFWDKKYLDVAVSGTKMIEALRYQFIYTGVILVETDLSTGTSVSTDTLHLFHADDLLFTYRREGSLCLVEKQKGKPFLLFHAKTFGRKIKTDTVRIDLPAIGKIGNGAFGGIDDFGDVEFGSSVQVLPNNVWLPVYAVKHRNKAFVQNDKFYVALNTADFSTWLLTVNLNDLTYTRKKFNPPFSDAPLQRSASGTAIVLDSFLITGLCTDKSIHFAMYNANSGVFLQTKTINEENFADLCAGKVVKVGDFWSRSNLTEITFGEFLSKATANQLIVEGYRQGDELFLTFGSTYKLWVSATLLGNLATAGMGGFAQVKPPSTVYFHTSWRLPSFAATKKPAKEVVWDKMLNHLFAARQLDGFNFTYMNGFYYIGYFSAAKRDYQLYRFDEKTE